MEQWGREVVEHVNGEVCFVVGFGSSFVLIVENVVVVCKRW